MKEVGLVQAAIAPRPSGVDAALVPIDEIVGFLGAHLGKKTTAYLSGVSDPKMVGHWIARRNTPRDGAQLRLREAYRIAELIVSVYGDETAKAWFLGSNAELGDRAPAYVIRTARTWEDLRLVLPAARAFAGALR
jgi:hypothetical protein